MSAARNEPRASAASSGEVMMNPAGRRKTGGRGRPASGRKPPKDDRAFEPSRNGSLLSSAGLCLIRAPNAYLSARREAPDNTFAGGPIRLFVWPAQNPAPGGRTPRLRLNFRGSFVQELPHSANGRKAGLAESRLEAWPGERKRVCGPGSGAAWTSPIDSWRSPRRPAASGPARDPVPRYAHAPIRQRAALPR